MNKFIITNGKIILPGRVLEGGVLAVENGTIRDIAEKPGEYPGYEIIDAQRCYVSPGLVEMHIHGCSSFGFDEDDPQILDKTTAFLSERGINTFVPTIQCNEAALANLADGLERGGYGDRIPGVYIEGPFVNEKNRGGILPRHIRMPDMGYMEKLLEISRGHIKLMTVAPELKGCPDIYDLLYENGITLCLGHSHAELHQVPAFDDRKMDLTHLFNTMSPVSHKKTGLAMLPFINPHVYVEVNADLIHLNADIITMCHKHLNKDRLILITDAVASAGAPYGSYFYFKKEVVSDEHGVRYKDDNTMVGSNCLITEVVKRFMKVTGSPIYEAVGFATLNPCRLLGLDKSKGSIEIGKEADLVIFDEDFNVVKNLWM
ncbi:N-acetylglucosamine-6-phosphate deacetylase [Fibrobacterota bacterium]